MVQNGQIDVRQDKQGEVNNVLSRLADCVDAQLGRFTFFFYSNKERFSSSLKFLNPDF